MSIELPSDGVTYLCTYWSSRTGDCEEVATRALSVEDREILGPWLNTRTENIVRAGCPEHLARMEGVVEGLRNGGGGGYGYGHPRCYTGDFPPGDGPDTADELVAALATSVERVRIKYSIAVRRLAIETGFEPAELLAQIDKEHAVTEQIPYRVGE